MEYAPRLKVEASYEELTEAAGRTPMGDSRQKALIDRADRKLIAKISSGNDVYSVFGAKCRNWQLPGIGSKIVYGRHGRAFRTGRNGADRRH